MRLQEEKLFEISEIEVLRMPKRGIFLILDSNSPPTLSVTRGAPSLILARTHQISEDSIEESSRMQGLLTRVASLTNDITNLKTRVVTLVLEIAGGEYHDDDVVSTSWWFCYYKLTRDKDALHYE